MNYIYNFNKDLDYLIFEDEFQVIDRKNGNEINFSGEKTKDYIIPIYKHFRDKFTIYQITKYLKKEEKEVKKVVDVLIECNAILENTNLFFSNTLNHDVFESNENAYREILIISDTYISQFNIIFSSFIYKKNIKFKFVIPQKYSIVNNDVLDDSIVELIYVDNLMTYLVNLDEKSKPNLILMCLTSFCSKDEQISYLDVENYVEKENIPIMYYQLNNDRSLVGPLYFPNKTTKLSDIATFDKSKFLISDCEQNFYIDPTIGLMSMSVLLNDLNSYIVYGISKLLVDHVVFCSKNPFYLIRKPTCRL